LGELEDVSSDSDASDGGADDAIFAGTIAVAPAAVATTAGSAQGAEENAGRGGRDELRKVERQPLLLPESEDELRRRTGLEQFRLAQERLTTRASWWKVGD